MISIVDVSDRCHSLVELTKGSVYELENYDNCDILCFSTWVPCSIIIVALMNSNDERWLSYMATKTDYFKTNPEYFIRQQREVFKEYQVTMTWKQLKDCSDLSREDLRFLYFLNITQNFNV